MNGSQTIPYPAQKSFGCLNLNGIIAVLIKNARGFDKLGWAEYKFVGIDNFDRLKFYSVSIKTESEDSISDAVFSGQKSCQIRLTSELQRVIMISVKY